MIDWRGDNTAHELLHEYKLRLTAASGGLFLAKEPQNTALDAICFFQGACLQARISIELLYFAILACRSPVEAKSFGQQWSKEYRPSNIKKRLDKLKTKYWPEPVTIDKDSNGVWRAEATQIFFTADETVQFYGKLGDMLHAKRDHPVAGIGADARWVTEDLEKLRNQTNQFIFYTENFAKHVVTMQWGEENPPHFVTLR